MSVERRIVSERLTAPRAHLGVLVEPAADAFHTLIATSRTHQLHSIPILDTSVGELRANLRRRLELTGPVILTGHQAEFCHAGVFAKTIAVSTLVTKFGGTGVFLTVDSDTPAATRLAVPRVEQGEAHRVYFSVPGCDPRLPMEWQPGADAQLWREFFDQIAETIGGGGDTLLPTYAEAALNVGSDPVDILGVLKRGHDAVERLLAVDVMFDARLSRLSETPEFRSFVGHLLLNAGDFARHYNEAQQAYRLRHRARNPHRPVPPLAVEGDRIELPLWVCRTGQIRRRLFVKARGDRLDLFADQEPIGTEPCTRLRHADTCAPGLQIEQAGWHIRPRALALSAFIRLFLSDLFVHGIGGAKYDEMTEDFIRRFLDVDLPPACCVSATAHLPLPHHGVSHDTLAAVRRARRDLAFNPQRYLSNLRPHHLRQREAAIATSGTLRRERRQDHAARRHTFDTIRAANQALIRRGESQVAELEREWSLVEQRWHSDRVARDRAYFFALHPRSTMDQLIQRIRTALS